MTHRQIPLGTPRLLVSILFTILAFAVAIWTATGIVSSCIDAAKLQNAVLVDARLLAVDRRIVEGGRGAIEQVTVSYSYEFDGEYFEHKTRTIALFAKGDELHDVLSNAVRTGEMIPCYVDPEQPSLSVFSMEFSISLFLMSVLFPIVFGGVAIICATSLFRRWRDAVGQRRKAH